MQKGQILSRVLDVPLLAHPAKAEIILNFLASREGYELPAATNLHSDGVELMERPSMLQGNHARDRRTFALTDEGIAVIPIMGALMKRAVGMSSAPDYGEIQTSVLDAATDPAVRGILLDIDSPGGEANGVFDLADTLFEARQSKPLWAVANDDAFSAAYLIGAASQKLYVTQTGGVGSIGAIAIHLDQTEFDKKIGAKYQVFRSGAYKAEHNSVEPLTDHAAQTLQARVDEIGALFAQAVARYRPQLTVEAIQAQEAGLYFSDAGLEAGLADQKGTLETAMGDLLQQLDAPTPVSGIGLTHTRQEDDPMPKEEKTTAGAEAGAGEEKVISLEKHRATTQAEADRVSGILAACKLAGALDRAQGFIDAGQSVEKVQGLLLDEMASQDEAADIDAHTDDRPGRKEAPVDLAQVGQEAMGLYNKAAGR